jgi:hypothetical protein
MSKRFAMFYVRQYFKVIRLQADPSGRAVLGVVGVAAAASPGGCEV